jgi:hypothetical protein
VVDNIQRNDPFHSILPRFSVALVCRPVAHCAEYDNRTSGILQALSSGLKEANCASFVLRGPNKQWK